jgi:hypothetical protein
MAALSAFAAPPPRVMAPPVESQEFEDHPEQIVFEASSLMTPPFKASVSDQRVIGPPFVRKLMLSAVRTLRLDFNTKALFAPVTVMFAPAVKSLDEPVAVSVTGPAAEIAADVVTLEPVDVTNTPPADAVRVAPLFVIVPEPDRVMLPVASIAPVGVTSVPPVISTTPAVAVKEAEPE